jgi:hypothetical protein
MKLIVVTVHASFGLSTGGIRQGDRGSLLVPAFGVRRLCLYVPAYLLRVKHVENVRRKFSCSPPKSMVRLSRQFKVHKTAVWLVVLSRLHLLACLLQILQQLKPPE